MATSACLRDLGDVAHHQGVSLGLLDQYEVFHPDHLQEHRTSPGAHDMLDGRGGEVAVVPQLGENGLALLDSGGSLRSIRGEEPPGMNRVDIAANGGNHSVTKLDGELVVIARLQQRPERPDILRHELEDVGPHDVGHVSEPAEKRSSSLQKEMLLDRRIDELIVQTILFTGRRAVE